VGSARARPDGFLSVTDAERQRAPDLGLPSAVRLTRAALPLLVKAGTAVTTAWSVAVALPDPLVIGCGAAEAAPVAFSTAPSKEVGPCGIRVSSAGAGPVRTEPWRGGDAVAARVSNASGSRPGDTPGSERRAARAPLTGRLCEPGEIAGLVLFLLGDSAQDLAGSDVAVDGGLTPTG